MAGKKKHPGGRPTVMTQEVVNKLEEAFALGCSDAEACLYADISKQTLYNYCDANPEFVDRKAQLKEKPILLARQSVIDGMKTDANLALKFLERRKKDEFSPSSSIDHTSSDGTMTPVTKIELVAKTNDDSKD